ncbi:MAG: DUF169 domain-containing protein [Candidatus Helarchaeota archaeon]
MGEKNTDISINEKIHQIQKILKIKYYPVGIKILHNCKTHEGAAFQPTDFKKRFCYYVKLAAEGASFLLKDVLDPDCYSPYICLGFIEPEYVEVLPHIKPASTTAILLGPLQHFTRPVDSIIFIVNAKQAMLISNAIYRITRKKLSINFGVSMAVCGDIVAHTITEKTPNLSMLCHGARIFSNFSDEELVFGIPYELFPKLYSALMKLEKIQEFELKIKKDVN